MNKFKMIFLLFLLVFACSKDNNDKNDTVINSYREQSLKRDNVVILVSDPYPPYVMKGEPGNQGFVVDAAILAFEKVGIKAVYENVPYERALIGLDNLKYDGLLAVSPGRDNYVYPNEYFSIFKNAFFVRKKSNWKWNGVKSLNGMVVGVVKGYIVSNDDLTNYIEKYSDNHRKVATVYGENSLELNLRKLINNRIDLIIEDRIVVWHTAERMNICNKIKSAGIIGKTEKLTVGFNMNNPKASNYAEKLSEGIKIIKQSGEYLIILKKYNLESKIQF